LNKLGNGDRSFVENTEIWIHGITEWGSNGFDRYHGAPSSYYDFRTYL